MWLLNTRTKAIKLFPNPQGITPPYAILSHTWGADEVTLQELQAFLANREESSLSILQSRKGYIKIEGCCAQARKNAFKWVWIDTCCIDKTSSTELSEAINSMFRWYKEAAVCYVYLEDVSLPEDYHAQESQFRKSRWFTRGWTLQELIAPKVVEFYDALWNLIDNRSRIRELIQDIAGVPAELFISESVLSASVAQRMSWVANRETTRKEDMAYCLLGLFDVNMPLLYGEGEKAFRRLQEEIIRQSNDHTIFAWGLGQSREESEARGNGIAALAKWPSDFVNCGKVVPCLAWQPSRTISFEKTKTGILLEFPIVFIRRGESYSDSLGIYGILNCRLKDNFF